MKTVETVSLILVRGGRILAERRRRDEAIFPGAVVVPGGHVEPGESPEEAGRRELREELGVDCSHFTPVDRALCPAGAEDQLNTWFLCEEWKGEPRCLEAAGLLWIGPGEVEVLDLAFDRAVMGRFFERLQKPDPAKA